MSNIPTQTPNRNTPQNGQRPPQQGQRPVAQNGQRPPQQGQRPVAQNGQRPPQQGQRPMPQNGQRPPQAGQRPVTQNGQRPPQQGQRPMPQNGQRPTQQGQRPMPQNGQRPPQQGQRPAPQGQRPRPQGTPGRPSKNDSSVKSLLKIAIIATAVLLVIAIIAGAITMSVTGVFDNLFDKNNTQQSGSGGGGGSSKPKPKPEKESGSGLSLPNNLNLPVKSESKNYLSTNASSVASISGISSEAAILVKMDGNVAIAGKNADTVIHPASTSKLMTLIVACENMPTTDALLTVEQWMEDYRIAEGGQTVGLKVGQQVSVEDALYLISYWSDTLACLMIAEHVAGSEQAFVSLMNKKAADMNLTNTHFANCTGNYDDVTNGSNNVANDYTVTTCRELAAIMNCAMNNTAVKKIITSISKRMQVYVNNEPETSLFPTTGWYKKRFGENVQINSDLKAIAGKTGNEDIPSNCFVTVAENTKTGEKYICVVIGSIAGKTSVSPSTSTEDTKTIYKSYT